MKSDLFRESLTKHRISLEEEREREIAGTKGKGGKKGGDIREGVKGQGYRRGEDRIEASK